MDFEGLFFVVVFVIILSLGFAYGVFKGMGISNSEITSEKLFELNNKIYRCKEVKD